MCFFLFLFSRSVHMSAQIVWPTLSPPPSPSGKLRPLKRRFFSPYTAAFLPWGVLAPLNILKLQLNKVSPGAHLWVPKETEQCQAACGIARMWATLFWSMQFAWACAYIYVHYHREQVGRNATHAPPFLTAASLPLVTATLTYKPHPPSPTTLTTAQVGLIYFGTATKLVVGAVLLKAYLAGVIFWPIGLVGSYIEFLFAFVFMHGLSRNAVKQRQG